MNGTRFPVPPTRAMMRADLIGDLEPLHGRRVALAAMEGPRYDRRIIGEIYLRPAGEPDGARYPYVDVTPEREWYAALIEGRDVPAGATTPWPAGCVWVEMPPTEG